MGYIIPCNPFGIYNPNSLLHPNNPLGYNGTMKATEGRINLPKELIQRTRIEAARRATTTPRLIHKVMNEWLDKNVEELSYTITMSDDTRPESDSEESEQQK